MKINAIDNVTPFLSRKKHKNIQNNPKLTVSQDVFVKNGVQTKPKIDKEEESKGNIVKLFDSLDMEYDKKRELANLLYYLLGLKNSESNNREKLLNLVQAGILESGILVNESQFASTNKNAQNDLNIFYDSVMEEKNLLHSFVPLYKNYEEALKNTKTGDVCQIHKEKNIRIRKEDELKSLFLSPKTYMEFFEPITRYALIQGFSGNCFLLGVIDSLYSNPNSRDRIIECFKENENGTVSVNLGGYEKDGTRIKQKDETRYEAKDIVFEFENAPETYDFSRGANAIKAIEYVYRKEAELAAESHIDETYVKYAFLLRALGDNCYIIKEGQKFYEDEIKLFLKYFDEYRQNPEDLSKKLISIGDMSSEITFLLNSDDEDEDEGFGIDIENEEHAKYLDAIMKRYESIGQLQNVPYAKFDGILPMPLAEKVIGIFDKEWDITNPYTDGGSPKLAFKKFNIESKQYEVKNNVKELSEILSSKDFNQKYAAVAVSDVNRNLYDKDLKIIQGHLYSIAPIEVDGEQMFSVKDPHNSCYENYMSKDEVLENFDAITIGKI